MKNMSNNLRVRVCRACNNKFLGGPRAWYCPTCRQIRRSEQNRKAKRNKRLGKSVIIGKTVRLCEVCGNPYVIASAMQKYCKNCAAEAIRKKDAEQGRAWAAKKRKDPEWNARRNEARRAAFRAKKEKKNVVVSSKD